MVKSLSCVQAGISVMMHDIRQNVSVRVSYDKPSGVLSLHASDMVRYALRSWLFPGMV